MNTAQVVRLVPAKRRFRELLKALRAIAPVLTALTVLFATKTASATNGASNGTAGVWFNTLTNVPANCTATLATSGLSSGADTVMAIVNNADNSIEGWNDDATLTVRYSQVPVAGGAFGKTLRVLVYAYSASTGGSATLTRTLSGSGCSGTQTWSINFGHGFEVDLGSSVPTGTHLIAVEKQLGITDPIMLYFPGTKEPSAFDDDSGNGYMPFIHVNQACNPTGGNKCKALLGAYSGTTLVNDRIQLYWDDGMHTADTDTDGLSDNFENWMRGAGTLPRYDKADSDGDGIKDGAELLGLDDSLLRLPFYGADPTMPDLFVEADWAKCTTPLGADCPEGVDVYRTTTTNALNTVTKFAGVGVRTHMDIGVASSGSNLESYGNWGGAARFATSAEDPCTYLTSVRAPYFHELQVQNGDRGNSHVIARCSNGGQNVDANTHELGHSVGIDHQGYKNEPSNPTYQNSMKADCKPNYRSIMNYAFQNAGAYNPNPTFSRNTNGDNTLVPTATREDWGLGANNTGRINALARFGLTPDSTGAVDWNRDGLVDTTAIRAAVTWAPDGWYGCGIGEYALNQADISKEQPNPALGWMPADSSRSATLFWVSRSTTANLSFRTTTTFADTCGNYHENSACQTAWSPAFPGTDGTPIPNAVATNFAPALVGYNAPGGQARLFVFENASSHLKFLTYNGTWSALQALPSGMSDDTVGPPTAVLLGDKVSVFAPSSSNQLRRWDYSVSLGTWAGPFVEQDTTGTPLTVVAGTGAAVTRGYVRESTVFTEEYALVYATLGTSNGTALPELQFATRTPSATGWQVQVGPQRGNASRFHTWDQPGLAFVPFDPANVYEGRYYLAWNERQSIEESSALRLDFTQGNRRESSGARRLVWIDDPSLGDAKSASATIINNEQSSRGGVSLVFAPGRDNNLRGVWSFNHKGAQASSFAPELDGIYTGSIFDQDDQVTVLRLMRCALVSSLGCP